MLTQIWWLSPLFCFVHFTPTNMFVLCSFQNTSFQELLPLVREHIIDGFSPKALELFKREFDFFDKVTSISGVLFPLPKDERRAGIRRYISFLLNTYMVRLVPCIRRPVILYSTCLCLFLITQIEAHTFNVGPTCNAAFTTLLKPKGSWVYIIWYGIGLVFLSFLLSFLHL